MKPWEPGSGLRVTSVTRPEVGAVVRSVTSLAPPLAQLASELLACRRCWCDSIFVARMSGVRASGLRANGPCSKAGRAKAVAREHGVQAGSSSGGVGLLGAPPRGFPLAFRPTTGHRAPHVLLGGVWAYV